MAYVSISDFIASYGSNSYKTVALILQNALNTLKFYHSSGYVYGALIPSNLLVTPNESYKVELRQGINPIQLPDDLSTLKLVDILGLSPEHFNGNQGLDHRSDLYGLGYIAYYLLTGEANPYGAKNAIDLAEKIKLSSLPDPSQVNPDIPEWLCGIVQKLTAPVQSKRYQSVFSLTRNIESGLESTVKPMIGFTASDIKDIPLYNSEFIGKEKPSENSINNAELYYGVPLSFGNQINDKKKDKIGFSSIKVLAVLLSILMIVMAVMMISNLIKNHDNSTNTDNQLNTQEQVNSAVSNNSSNASNSNAEVSEVVFAWTDGLNTRNFEGLHDLYAEKVHYYGEYLSPDEIVYNQRKLLEKYQDFNQVIASEISTQRISNEEIRLYFVKRVLHNGKTKDYPSYLIVRFSGAGYKIVTESDLITDRNLSISKK